MNDLIKFPYLTHISFTGGKHKIFIWLRVMKTAFDQYFTIKSLVNNKFDYLINIQSPCLLSNHLGAHITFLHCNTQQGYSFYLAGE